MKSKTDTELVADFVSAGNEAAFTEIVTRHGPLVYRVCLGILGDAHEAEDCSQAVFLVLTKKAAFLRKNVNLASWLYGVTLTHQQADPKWRGRTRWCIEDKELKRIRKPFE